MRSRAGQSLIETTLILAAFVGLLLGVLEIGKIMFVRQTLVERARTAARWGALHPYDSTAIQNLVLYGTSAPTPEDAPFAGLARTDVAVGNPGCPGPDCRIRVELRGEGVLMIEPAP
jgi:hypothetical protein